MGFVKLHGSILDSSVWSLPHAHRIVWITMLAMTDEHGIVNASVDGLARRACVTIQECQDALAALTGPDPYSRDGTSGERIEKVPGGWLVLNHANYRDKQTREQALTAIRVARHRAKQQGVTGNDVTPGNAASRSVTPHLPTSPSEAEADADADPESEMTTTTRGGWSVPGTSSGGGRTAVPPRKPWRQPIPEGQDIP